jgi:hypothetical protein
MRSKNTRGQPSLPMNSGSTSRVGMIIDSVSKTAYAIRKAVGLAIDERPGICPVVVGGE